MPRGRQPETYYIYSAIRGNLIDTAVGHKAARRRAGVRWMFCNSLDADLVYEGGVQIVRIKDREVKTARPW